MSVKQEELKLVELELTRESEELSDATDRLAESNSALNSALDGTSQSLQEQIDRAIELQTIYNSFEPGEFVASVKTMADALKMDFAEAMGIAGAAWTSLMGEKFGGFGGVSGAGGQVIPNATIPPINYPSTAGGSTGAGQTFDVNINLSDALGDIIARENVKIQERGDTFVLG